MLGVGRFLDVCDGCNGRELEFIFFDLAVKNTGARIKDIPGFRCRECGEILVSNGVLETIDDLEIRELTYFPAEEYQKKVLKLNNDDRKLCERYLHSWEMVRGDERCHLDVWGFRVLGEWQKIANL